MSAPRIQKKTPTSSKERADDVQFFSAENKAYNINEAWVDDLGVTDFIEKGVYIFARLYGRAAQSEIRELFNDKIQLSPTMMRINRGLIEIQAEEIEKESDPTIKAEKAKKFQSILKRFGEVVSKEEIKELVEETRAVSIGKHTDTLDAFLGKDDSTGEYKISNDEVKESLKAMLEVRAKRAKGIEQRKLQTEGSEVIDNLGLFTERTEVVSYYKNIFSGNEEYDRVDKLIRQFPETPVWQNPKVPESAVFIVNLLPLAELLSNNVLTASVDHPIIDQVDNIIMEYAGVKRDARLLKVESKESERDSSSSKSGEKEFSRTDLAFNARFLQIITNKKSFTKLQNDLEAELIVLKKTKNASSGEIKSLSTLVEQADKMVQADKIGKNASPGRRFEQLAFLCIEGLHRSKKSGLREKLANKIWPHRERSARVEPSSMHSVAKFLFNQIPANRVNMMLSDFEENGSIYQAETQPYLQNKKILRVVPKKMVEQFRLDHANKHDEEQFQELSTSLGDAFETAGDNASQFHFEKEVIGSEVSAEVLKKGVGQFMEELKKAPSSKPEKEALVQKILLKKLDGWQKKFDDAVKLYETDRRYEGQRSDFLLTHCLKLTDEIHSTVKEKPKTTEATKRGLTEAIDTIKKAIESKSSIEGPYRQSFGKDMIRRSEEMKLSSNSEIKPVKNVR